MSSLPLIFGIGTAQYPISRSIQFDTVVAVAANGSEQRCVRNVPLFRFSFSYSDLLAADQTSLLNFFNGQLGMRATNWSAALKGITYANLTFEEDTIQWTRRDAITYEGTLKFRQTQNPGFSIPVVGAFPTLSAGLSFQRPYSADWRNLTVAGDQATGERYAFGFYGTSILRFPTRPLRAWHLNYPILADTDVATLENHFIGCQGRWQTFQFTDDTGTVYPFCRYGDDTMTFNYRGPNLTDCSFSIVEYHPTT